MNIGARCAAPPETPSVHPPAPRSQPQVMKPQPKELPVCLAVSSLLRRGPPRLGQLASPARSGPLAPAYTPRAGSLKGPAASLPLGPLGSLPLGPLGSVNLRGLDRAPPAPLAPKKHRPQTVAAHFNSTVRCTPRATRAEEPSGLSRRYVRQVALRRTAPRTLSPHAELMYATRRAARHAPSCTPRGGPTPSCFTPRCSRRRACRRAGPRRMMSSCMVCGIQAYSHSAQRCSASTIPIVVHGVRHSGVFPQRAALQCEHDPHRARVSSRNLT